jgi:hypothetical protein
MDAASVQAMIHRSPATQTIVLRRQVSVTPQSFADFLLRACLRQYGAAELTTGVMQGDWEIIVAALDLAARGFPSPPRKGDRVVIGPTIQAGAWVDGTGTSLTVQNPGARAGGWGYWMTARG